MGIDRKSVKTKERQKEIEKKKLPKNYRIIRRASIAQTKKSERKNNNC